MLKKLLEKFFGGAKSEDAEELTTPKAKKNQLYKTMSNDYHQDVEEDEDDDYDDDQDNDEDEQDSDRGVTFRSPLDPETYHGSHYTVQEFDAELERRVAQAVKEEMEEEGEALSKSDINSLTANVLQELYAEWNFKDVGDGYATSNALMDFQNRNSLKYLGQASGFNDASDSDDNPLLEPIHGVSLQDYAAISYMIGNGADFNAILSQLGIDEAIWAEANTLWTKRMTEDTTSVVAIRFGEYYGKADQHPKLSAVKPEISEQGKATLAKLEADRYFYEELGAAVTAAYECGLDGTKWLMDNHGITNADYQRFSSLYGVSDNAKIDFDKLNEFQDYRDKKQKEYAEQFAKQQGGNVADDIAF
jgi:hypothetical protein